LRDDADVVGANNRIDRDIAWIDRQAAGAVLENLKVYLRQHKAVTFKLAKQAWFGSMS